MAKIKHNFKSVRFKLFLTMCIVIAIIVLCLVAINSIVLESFYLYSKTNTVTDLYKRINMYYNSDSTNNQIEDELRRIAFNNNFDIFIETDQNTIVFSTDKDLFTAIDILSNAKNYKNKDNLIYSDE